MHGKKIIGLFGAISFCLGAAISVEFQNISDQIERLQSAADHAAVSAQRSATAPELWAYSSAARQQLADQFDDLELTIEEELSDDFFYTIRLSTPVNFRISSFGIFPKVIQKPATVAPSVARKTQRDIDLLLPKTNFGTRTIMNIHNGHLSNQVHISDNQDSLSLAEILKLAENTYFEKAGPDDNSRLDVIVIATNKPIDAVSCKLISERNTSMIIHPYGPAAEEAQNSCPDNMIYCCNHKIIRWSFTTDTAKLNSNISEILTGLGHLHISC